MAEEKQIKVWDIAVRIFHWSLVLFFTVAYVTGEEESQLHILAGYVILGLIVFRVIWGLIGTRYARFWNFIYSPKHTLAYTHSLLSGQPKHYLGHNPLGGWMILALIVFITLTIWSGLELEASAGRGPLVTAQQLVQPAYANDVQYEHEGDEFWEELHEVFANLTLLLIFLHVAGVVVSGMEQRENLVKAMITGYKQKRN